MTTGADRKLLALGIKSTLFTLEELHKALDFLLKAMKTGMMPTQQKSYGDFQHPGGVPLLNISTEQKEVNVFAELARQNGVNVSLKYNQESNTYYLCLQGTQKNIENAVITYCQHVHKQRHSQVRSSLLARLEQAKIRAQSYIPDRGKTHERELIGRRDTL